MKFNLRSIRESKGMSQTELAEKSGVGRVTINRIENGELNETTSGTLIKLAKTLQVPVDSLIES